MDVLDVNIKAEKDIIGSIKSAVRDNDVQAVEDLLEGLGDLSSLLNKVSEIWDLVLEYRRVEVLEALLENLEFKKNINVKNSEGLTPLMKAAKLENASAVQRLLAAGAECEISSEFCSKKTALYYAIENGKARALKVFINNKLISPAILVDLLKFAVFRNNVNAVKILLKADFDITTQTAGNPYEQDGTVLHMVASSDKIEILDLLLKHKDINQVLNLPDDENGFTPLMRAVRKGHTDTVKKLIRAGADITIRIKENPYGWDGATALHIAAEVSIIEVLELLLGHRDIKKILDFPGGDGYTALMGAVFRGRKDAVSRLIEAGADITIQITGNFDRWDGATALYLAAFCNKIEVLELLLKHEDIKKILNLPKQNGYTPLMCAAFRGHADVVSKLIDAGADITIQITGNPDEWDGATALYLAAFSNRIEVLELLLKHEDIKKILNLSKQNGYTPLMCAASKGHEDAVSKLIDAGADIMAQNREKNTAAHLAAKYWKEKSFGILIVRAPEVWKMSNVNGDIPVDLLYDKATALYTAAEENEIEMLKLVLKRQDIKQVLNLPWKNGFTPLMGAAFNGHEDAVSKLIDAGADITIQITGNLDRWDGATALYLVAFRDKIEVLELLLKHEDIKQVLNLPNREAVTPLMGAAFKGHEDAVSKLIDAGADITIQITDNPDGWDGATALYIAATFNKIEVLELFLKHNDVEKVLNLPRQNGFTPLMGAASKGHEEAVSKLIDAGANITAQNQEKNTAAHLAAEYGKEKSLGMLIVKAHEVLTMLNEAGHTPEDLLNSRQKNLSSEVSIFSDDMKQDGGQKKELCIIF